MDIVQIADELESLPDTGTRVPGFRKKVLVETDRLIGLSEELRNAVPANIREAQEVLKQKDSIVKQAYLEAQRIKSAAEEEASAVSSEAQRAHQSMVDESEVVKSAEAKAQDIEEEANRKAQQITQDAQKRAYRVLQENDLVANTLREGADRYAREVMFSLEEQLSGALGQVRAGIDRLGIEAQPEGQEQKVDEPVPA